VQTVKSGVHAVGFQLAPQSRKESQGCFVHQAVSNFLNTSGEITWIAGKEIISSETAK
jgi:hypothetical protein